MKVGVDVSQHQLTWPELRQRVLWAEEHGFDSAWLLDHFKALYGDPGGPCLEAWTLLAALGAVTDRIRLGALVTGVTYRHPSLLATEAVTVDHVSGGRLNIGIGAAWFEDEHRELGFDFPPPSQRARRLDEALHVMKALMTTDGANFRGRMFRLEDATYRPRPVQSPYPPIWIGAKGEKVMLPLVARHADVWHAHGSIEALARKSALLDGLAKEAGRDPGAIQRSTNLSLSESWDEVMATGIALREMGFHHVIASWPADGYARVEKFVKRIVPELVAA